MGGFNTFHRLTNAMLNAAAKSQEAAANRAGMPKAPHNHDVPPRCGSFVSFYDIGAYRSTTEMRMLSNSTLPMIWYLSTAAQRRRYRPITGYSQAPSSSMLLSSFPDPQCHQSPSSTPTITTFLSRGSMSREGEIPDEGEALRQRNSELLDSSSFAILAT